VDKIEWPIFYEKLVQIMDMWTKIKNGEDALKPIMNKWASRKKDITLLMIAVISLYCRHIEKNF
jgi:predicted ABC-class ATPase